MFKLYQKKYDEARLLDIEADSNEGFRSCYRKDFGRLIHSASFRRLQGKTQLFPSYESDFFRNRLTHSLEVAQIAKSIAAKVNSQDRYFKNHKIDLDVVEIAALAHDIGHPPFGHNGEYALDECMRDFGGFEGNAQTFRIIGRLEKRDTLEEDNKGPIAISKTGDDLRCGLNLTARVLAAVLKYEDEIPLLNSERGDDKDQVVKGYYQADRTIVDFVRKNITRGKPHKGAYKTIECSIMDVSDDIAYSTYDLEDSFKAGFIDPLTMFSGSDELFDKVAKKVDQKIRDAKYPKKAVLELVGEEGKYTASDVEKVLMYLFGHIFVEGAKKIKDKSAKKEELAAYVARDALRASQQLAKNGYYRTEYTSALIKRFISGIQIIKKPKVLPTFYQVRLDLPTFAMVEVLKRYNFEAQILSSRLKVTEHRGKDIVKKIFESIKDGDGELLPEDYRQLYKRAKGTEKYRMICDFVAGMTDSYAVEFYNRITGSNPVTIHKPF